MDTQDAMVHALQDRFAYDLRLAALGDIEYPIFECPECELETYIVEEDQCANCELNPGECRICGTGFSLNDMGFPASITDKAGQVRTIQICG